MSEHIVILGGGFAGWYTARALAPRLRSGNRITLIDRVDHMLYTPMLTEVAGGNLQPHSIAVPMKSLPKRVNIIRSEISAIDAAAKTVTLRNGDVIRATQLVIALGSTTAYHGIGGAREHSLPLKTLADASRVLARINDVAARSAASRDHEPHPQPLSIVLAGGGYTGVETLAAVSEHVQRSLAAVHRRSPGIKLVLIEPTGRLMSETPEPLALYSQIHLQQHHVDVLFNTAVKSVDGPTVTLTRGDPIHADLLLWDTGIEPSPLLRETSLPLGKHHGVVVNGCFEVQGFPGVWAIGDCAEIPQPSGKPYAATAQNATREGTHLAQNISAVLRGDRPRPFRFSMLGQLALLSDKKAVAEILGIQIKGVLAWALWWVIYTAKLPWMPGRVSVIRDLAAGQKQRSLALPPTVVPTPPLPLPAGEAPLTTSRLSA